MDFRKFIIPNETYSILSVMKTLAEKNNRIHFLSCYAPVSMIQTHVTLSKTDCFSLYLAHIMIYSNMDLKNLVSFGVVSPDGITDITFTISNNSTFRISGKGVPMQTVPLDQILSFTQSVFDPSILTIYYKNTFLPQTFGSLNSSMCSMTTSILNHILLTRDYSINDWYFNIFIEGQAEKQGKRLWAQRYLMIVGCRLLVLRYPTNRKQGDENLPLNVIDLTNACITRKSNTVLSLCTHREYQFRFSSPDDTLKWFVELKNASARGTHLFDEQSINPDSNEVPNQDECQDANPCQNSTSTGAGDRNPTQALTQSQSQQQLTSPAFNPTEPPSRLLHRPAPLDMELCTSPDESLHEPPIIPHSVDFSTISSSSNSRYNSLLNPLPSSLSRNYCQQPHDVFMFSVYSWGNNVRSQLGQSVAEPFLSTPTKLDILSGPHCFPIQLAAGTMHALCLTDEGEIIAWGAGNQGQLGLGSIVSESEPRRITLFQGLPVSSIACGGFHSACICNNGNIYTWGDGTYGQLGHGIDVSIATQPIYLARLKGADIQSVYCGQNHTIFLSSKGVVYACGNGYYGQLGLDIGIDYFVPTIVNKLVGYCITQVACGETFTIFVTSDNQLIVSGMLETEETAFTQNREIFAVPHIVPFDDEIIKVSAGTRFALLLTSSGKVYSWKPNPSCPNTPSSPTCIESLSDKLITDIECGMLHCIAFSSVTGKTYAWGINDSGELGTNNQNSTDSPQEIEVPQCQKFIQVRCGGAFTLGITLQLSSVSDTKASEELFTRSGNLVSPITLKNDTLDNNWNKNFVLQTVINSE